MPDEFDLSSEHDEEQPHKRNVDKVFEGLLKLNKTDTVAVWKEFGGEPLAVLEPDGNAYILRKIEYETRKKGQQGGIRFILSEKLTRNKKGYGFISWQLTIGSITRRKPPKIKFQENWSEPILKKVRDVIENGTVVTTAAKILADDLGIPYSTIRANLWVANKWAKGEATSFLPHRSMIRPIFDLLCELGKRDMVLISLSWHCTAVKKPAESVLAILNEFRK